MDKKVVSAIISSLILVGFAVSTYSFARCSESRANLETHKDVLIRETPVINDIIVEDVGYAVYDAPYTSGFKSYMDYRAITSTDSLQYVLQNEYAHTGNYGIRMVNDRYCIAVGSRFTSDIGQYIDLVLENGTVIPCILADQKADEHTDDGNIVTMHNGCMSEFVVDTDSLDHMAKICGDISYCENNWQSRVVKVKVYNENIFYK